MNVKKTIYKYTPGVYKRGLLLVAAIVWTIAGGILLFRGSDYLIENIHPNFWDFLIGATGGIVFYVLMFKKIPHKHITRIKSLEHKKHLGITIRKLNLVNPVIIYTFFITMAVPLLISAFRFYYEWHKYDRDIHKNQPTG